MRRVSQADGTDILIQRKIRDLSKRGTEKGHSVVVFTLVWKFMPWKLFLVSGLS